MLIISLKLLKTNKDDKKYLEYSAKCALQNNDKEFAWKTALLQENIS